MKTDNSVFVKAILTSIIWIVLGIDCQAQSLQEGSIWAPENIKIDAKLNEWNNSLAANNKTTNLYYTICNDAKNIYLAIKCTDQSNSTKIVNGGITFTINTAGRKKDKDAFIVIYPKVNRSAMSGQFRQRRAGGAAQTVDSAAMKEQRKQLLASAKEISIKGFRNIPDSVISIYNEYGIKAAVGYDSNGSFIYELALPLKELGLSPTNIKELAYNIKINGMQMGQRGNNTDGNPREIAGRNAGADGGNRSNRGGGGEGGFGGGGMRINVPSGNSGGMNMQDMMSPTDFWGKYVLAKSK